MRRGIALSLMLHFFLGVFVMLELPDFVMPEKEIQQINVKLVTAPSKAKKDVKSAKPKPVVTQQSAAPKYAPKKQKEAKQESKHKTKVVKKQKSKKIVKKKKQKPKKQQKKAKAQKKKTPKKSDIRPEKLDKTAKKKSVVKSKDKKAKPNKVDDDFLSALDFADNIETKEKPSVKADEEDEAGVYDADQVELAKIKRKIQRNWYVTAGSNKLEKLITVVRLYVERDGTIRKVRIVKSSGKGSFDRSLQRAIRKSSPIPIPAGKYEIYKTIELRFKR